MTLILIVDDSTSIRKMVEAALRFGGFSVAGAVDGMDALEKLQRDPYDLVVLDINMPRLDGLSLLKIVRARPRWAMLPILMLTTEGAEADRDRALALGATDYMVKPFRPTDLLERVTGLLEAGKNSHE